MVKRKLLAARVDLADKVSEIASRKGTLYDYVNEVLEQAIRAEELGVTLRKVLDDRWLIKSARDAGFILVPEKILYELAEDACKSMGKERLLALWYETGEWYGKYYDDLERFVDAVKKYFWDVIELSVSEDDDQVMLTCLSSRFSEVYTELFGKFLEGALNVLGYSLREGDISKGIIHMRFVKQEGNRGSNG